MGRESKEYLLSVLFSVLYMGWGERARSTYYQCCFQYCTWGGEREQGVLTISVVFSTVHGVGRESKEYLLSRRIYSTTPGTY